jgi:hypothetical protein
MLFLIEMQADLLVCNFYVLRMGLEWAYLASEYQIQLQTSNTRDLTLRESSFNTHYILDKSFYPNILNQFVDDLCFGFAFETCLDEIETAI